MKPTWPTMLPKRASRSVQTCSFWRPLKTNTERTPELVQNEQNIAHTGTQKGLAICNEVFVLTAPQNEHRTNAWNCSTWTQNCLTWYPKRLRDLWRGVRFDGSSKRTPNELLKWFKMNQQLFEMVPKRAARFIKRCSFWRPLKTNTERTLGMVQNKIKIAKHGTQKGLAICKEVFVLTDPQHEHRTNAWND
jgi:hypothetical protein